MGIFNDKADERGKWAQGSGSAPLPQKPVPPAPPVKPLQVSPQDADIVQYAACLDEKEQDEARQNQTQGKQTGFTQVSVDGVLQAREKADSRAPEENPAPPENGQVLRSRHLEAQGVGAYDVPPENKAMKSQSDDS